jgi:two-component system, chemotaxis family, protein-glutamate methylesterase/glutaminase
MSRHIRVLVVDDSAYIRKVVKEMLGRSPEIEVVGTARDGDDALEQCERLQPDVVTCDLIMPGVDGIEFIRRPSTSFRSRRRSPRTKSSMSPRTCSPR